MTFKLSGPGISYPRLSPSFRDMSPGLFDSPPTGLLGHDPLLHPLHFHIVSVIVHPMYHSPRTFSMYSSGVADELNHLTCMKGRFVQVGGRGEGMIAASH